MSSNHGVGIIGLGYWGPNLVRAFMNTADANVVKVCDNDPQKLSKIKQLYSVEGSQDCADVLNDGAVETVVIATPTKTHFSLAKAALENDKHVFITKPLTSDPEEADILVALAKEKGRLLHLDHTFVYTPAVRKLKEVVSNPGFGPINYVDSTRINLGLFQRDTNVIWDLAPHDLAILNYLTGETPTHVRAYSNNPLVPPYEHLAYVSLDYPSGLLAHLHLNWLSPIKVRRMIVGGTKNMVIYDDADNAEKIKLFQKGIELVGSSTEDLETKLVQYRTGDVMLPFIENREALLIECAEYIEAVTTGSSTITTGQVGADVVHICHALTESVRDNGKRIALQ